ncbi:hypothetical protein RhiJN_08106 [Ceratobasidium sp. AG-Ba]|nr:hypothetical protein RhiJN_08106 [Ceratobasidium sp. AG-Ba]QRW08862.1 hypothetical protein RhiLY_07861 [Ceratobasidium sp. AG-Ba]
MDYATGEYDSLTGPATSHHDYDYGYNNTYTAHGYGVAGRYNSLGLQHSRDHDIQLGQLHLGTNQEQLSYCDIDYRSVLQPPPTSYSKFPTQNLAPRPTSSAPAIIGFRNNEVLQIGDDELPAVGDVMAATSAHAHATLPQVPSGQMTTPLACPHAPLAHPVPTPAQPGVVINPQVTPTINLGNTMLEWLVPEWKQWEYKRYLNNNERVYALRYLADGVIHMLWEKQGMLDAIVNSEDPVRALKEAKQAPKAPTRNPNLSSIWNEICWQSCGNKRSMHLVVPQFWKMINTCLAIRAYNNFTGSNGDGDVGPDATLLEKIGRKLKKARAAGIASCDDLTPAGIEAWTTPAGSSMFDTLDALLVASQDSSRTQVEYHSSQGEASTSSANPKKSVTSRQLSSQLSSTSHNIFSLQNSTGPTRTQSTRNTGAAISPISMLARPHVKKPNQGGKDKHSLGPGSASSACYLGPIFWLLAEKAAASRSRVNATKAQKGFLLQVAHNDQKLKDEQAKAVVMKLRMEAKAVALKSRVDAQVTASNALHENILQLIKTYDTIIYNPGMSEDKKAAYRVKKEAMLDKAENIIADLEQLQKEVGGNDDALDLDDA